MRETKTEPERMACMEIWGGNKPIDRHFEAPGLDIFVNSVPFENSTTGGGDIYYLTSCASGRISRFLLADVSGHGAEASGVALKLRDLLRQNVNKISQQSFVSEMNVEFGRHSEQDGFATAIVSTFFEPTRTLHISVAGHPYPFYYSSDYGKWVYLDPAESKATYENLPLGIIEEANYPGRKIKTRINDMFLIYSDSLIESTIQGEDSLGIAGVIELLNGGGDLKPAEVIPFLKDQIGNLDSRNLQEDDTTMMLGVFTETKVRLRDNLVAPFRMFGQARDRTKLDNETKR